MRSRRNLNLIAATIFALSILTVSKFVSQSPTPMPSSSVAPPSVSPSASPSQTQSPRATPTPPPSAQNFHQWGSITVFNGLPSDSVRAIAQTTDGVMWFGTDNGLARFDGRHIEKFEFGDADSNRILVLRTNLTHGDLWVGTRNGAFILSGSRFQAVAGTEGQAISTIVLGDESFLASDTGVIFAAEVSTDGAVNSRKLTSAILSADGTPTPITGVLKAGDRLVVVTRGRGVLELRDGTFTDLSGADPTLVVNTVAENGKGKVWIGADAPKGLSGIYSIEIGAKSQRITAPTASVLAIEVNESGVWAGTERYGLFQINGPKDLKTYTFDNTSGGLRSDTIFTLFTDREGVLWIGTNRGVSRFDRLGSFQETVSDIPNSNFIRSLFRPRENWTLAGSNRGLFLSEGKTWKPVPGFDGKVVFAIAEHKNTEVLVGTLTGLFDLNGSLIAPGDVRAFATVRSGTYAAIAGRGVIQIRTGARGFGLSSPADGPLIFPNETVSSIAEGSERLWIGTAGKGLFSFDGTTVKKEAEPDVLKSGTIWNMFQSQPNGPLYVAGQHGVFAFRDGVAEQIVAVEDVRDVFERDGQLWAATTTKGLLHARHDDRFGWIVSSIGFEQGLPSEKAFSIRPSGKDLIIATNRGVVTYRSGTVAPKLIATRVISQRMHDLAELRSKIELDYPQNSLLIEVAGQSSRTFPEEFQYAFQLRDSKGGIVKSRLSNDAQFAPADLSPGEYTIETIAFNRDLLASEPLTIHFSVGKAPFPLTATALGILLVIALFALVWVIIERRRISQSNTELAAARVDLANESERERSRIARDLHDQTLADLRNLMMMSDRVSPGNTEFRLEIESISTEIRRICEDLSPSVLENVGLVAALEFLLSRSVEHHTFTHSEDANEKVKFSLIIQLHIYRIAQEILTNIVRHSSANTVAIDVQVFDDGRFLLAIGDNGPTFRPDDVISKGRGIANIRSRADIINAEIEWSIDPDGGNLFSLELAGNSSV